MRKLSSVLVVATVLGAAHGVESGSSDQKGSAKSVDCLADFNAARERAGLEAFIAETDNEKILSTGDETYIGKICSAIQEASDLHLRHHCRKRSRCDCLLICGKVVNVTEANTKREGTYAYAPETGPVDGCSAAVSYWKKAYVNFGELPPEYNKDTDVYKDSRNLSLVALYNPNEGATLDCAYITCPISTATTTAAPTTTSSAAVSYWKKAHVNFGELPPEYEDKNDVYADSQNMSLVALYNPKEGATLDCAYITCPISTATTTSAPTTTSATTSSSSSNDAGGSGGGTGGSAGSGGGGGTGGNGGSGAGGDSGSSGSSGDNGGSFFSAERRAGVSASRGFEGRASAAAPIFYPVSREGDSGDPQRTGPSVRRLSTTSETVTGLVCLTNPAALVDGQKPFTQQLWFHLRVVVFLLSAHFHSLSACAPCVFKVLLSAV
ncbi:SAG family member [Eimeria mitis]|uniref:SAG family member n=1 Tax=Eimeria mitis TaxID=44415 RepID=U6JVD5_9EIME|nr:SAG family member [Eimeria mitis]CDJ29425.1 SAG family member [Eimeria mitis]